MPPSRVALGRRPGSACSTTTWRTGSSPSGRSCSPPSPRPDPRVRRPPTGGGHRVAENVAGSDVDRRAQPADRGDPTGPPASPGRWPRLPPARPPPLASGHRQPQPLRGTPRWTTPQMTQEDQRSRGPERLPAHTLGAQELKQVSQVVAVRACRVRAVPSVDQMTEVPDDRHDGLTPIIKQQHPPNDAAVLVLDDAHPGSSPPAPTGSGGQPPAGEANVAACPDNRELRQGGEDRVPLRSVAPTRQVGTLASSTSVGGGLEGGQGPSSSVGSCPGPALDHVRVPAPCGCPLGFAVGAGEPGRRWRS